MPQAIQAQPPVTQTIPSSGTPGGGAEAPDSGQSFESALAGHRAADDAPVRDVRTVKNSKPEAPADADAPVAAELAASGNLLPPALPPVPVDPALAASADAALLLAGDVPDFSVAPESVTDVLAATVPAIPVSIQPPVVLPATDGQSFSASVESSLNRPAVATVAARTAAADAQTLAALAAEAVTTAPNMKTPDLTASLDVFRAALKDIAPAADARPVLTSMMSASGILTASSFTNALASVPAGAPFPGASIAVPFGQAGWGQAFGNQVVWAVNQGMPAAELHLSPPDLGPMSVRISMDQDQASISFSSAHAMVREAVEAALPRLRDMLGAQGITLADVNVSQHGAAGSQRETGAGWSARRDGDAQGGPTDVAVAQRIATGVLDIYV